MDRELELRHLEEAEQYIEQARQRIARVEDAIVAAAERGEDVSQGRATLGIMRYTLDTFLEQRDQILRTIADIDAGRYGIV